MKRFAISTCLLSGFLFGVATPFCKLLLTDLNPFQLAGFFSFKNARIFLVSIFTCLQMSQVLNEILVQIL
jgi:hypothetical protein